MVGDGEGVEREAVVSSLCGLVRRICLDAHHARSCNHIVRLILLLINLEYG